MPHFKQYEEQDVLCPTYFLEEFMSRNFSKRHTNIISLIMRCSLGCNKETAFIPHLYDFEACGICRTKIKKELLTLEDANIITWDRKNMLFKLSLDFDKWEMPQHSKYDPDKIQKVIDLNCSDQN